MSDNRAGTLEVIAVQIARFFDPVRRELVNGSLIELFAELGLVFPAELETSSAFAQALSAALAPIDEARKLIDALLAAADSGDMGAVVDAFEDLVSGIQAATDAFSTLADGLNAAAAGNQLPGMTTGEVAAFTADLASRLFQWSAVTYVEEAVPALASALDLLEVIERTEEQVGSVDPKRPQFTRKQLHLDKLPRAASSPFGALEDLYGFGSPSFDPAALFARLESLLSRVGFPVFNDVAAVPPTLDLVFAELTRDDSSSPPGLALSLKTKFNQDFTASLPPLTLSATARLLVAPGGVLLLNPKRGLSLQGPASSSASGELRLKLQATPSPPLVLIGRAEGSRLELGGITFDAGSVLKWNGSTAAVGSFEVGLGLQGLHLLVEPPSGDGFLAEILPSNGIDAAFDLGLQLSDTGFKLTGSASLAVVLPLNLDLGVATVDAARLVVGFDSGALTIELGALVRGRLGPVSAVVDGIGLKTTFTFPGSGGNLGPIQGGIAFLPPSGVGVSLDAGGVRGGGFLSIEQDRYSGALELSVYGISVKAFGLIETKLPDGTPGFSFVIVIVAEFTPIQLGFGFTLLGVGGLVGVNRTINEQALGDGVRTGSLQHLLFPQNVVQDAPAIIHDLATVFPAAKGHFIIGPMAKLGWGTPTLITADLGIILEFPGPRLALLGLVRMVLPSADAAILRLQMAISGLLDFPAKKVSVDASLFDSTVAGFVVTADMAYRMQFGNSASFLLSVGGFNTGFQPPAPFPKLRRASVDFGISGNPSLVASGYFALTSNTAQIGASIQLHASGFGIHLDGWLGFDVLFVFSPFSFKASISAGVRVSFHGVGFGITLHGSLSGPTPWHLDGKVCVSVLWWDACLPVSITFGHDQPASLPEIDPWFGNNDVPVVGLADAISDPRNWAGSPLPSEFAVVTLAAAATSERTPIDPLGAATLRQKVAPFNRKLQKFGQYKPKDHDQFSLGPGIGSVVINTQPVSELEVVQDEFAPDHFMQLTNEQKLALPSYEPMDAGIAVAPNRTSVGSASSRVMEYVTKYIDDQGTVHDNQPRFRLTQAQLDGLLTRSASALGGVRNAGAEKYILAGRPKKIQLGPRGFVVADACSLVRNDAITGTEVSQTQAVLALAEHTRLNPQDSGRFAVVPGYTARAA